MEPYRWLEAVRHRREYIEDQIGSATPVFAASRPQGVLLLGVGLGQSKVFEIFDRHGLAALGNPVDIEKLRYTAIESAHTDAFNRSAGDVSLRRLVNYALSTALKNNFEQIYSPPLMVESVFGEVGAEPEDDQIYTLSYDGDFELVQDGVAVVSPNKQSAAQAKQWILPQLKRRMGLDAVARVLMTAWNAMLKSQAFDDSLKVVERLDEIDLGGKKLEAALLDRKAPERVKFRLIDLSA